MQKRQSELDGSVGGAWEFDGGERDAQQVAPLFLTAQAGCLNQQVEEGRARLLCSRLGEQRLWRRCWTDKLRQMPRYATIDVGTNAVLLLVADRQPDGRFQAVRERAEITRLGRGVDRSRRLSPEGMEDTLQVLSDFASEARSLGAEAIAVSATSAARDAENGAEFLSAVQQRADVTVDIISGELEAQLCFTSAYADFGRDSSGPLVVMDTGGGSTEFIYGDTQGRVSFCHSFDVGSVRVTERYVTSDPLTAEDRARVEAHLRETFSALPPVLRAPGSWACPAQ